MNEEEGIGREERKECCLDGFLFYHARNKCFALTFFLCDIGDDDATFRRCYLVWFGCLCFLLAFHHSYLRNESGRLCGREIRMTNCNGKKTCSTWNEATDTANCRLPTVETASISLTSHITTTTTFILRILAYLHLKPTILVFTLCNIKLLFLPFYILNYGKIGTENPFCIFC